MRSRFSLFRLIGSIDNRIEFIDFDCTKMNTGRNYIINSGLCKFKSIGQILLFVLYQRKRLKRGIFTRCIPGIGNRRQHQIFLFLIIFLLMMTQSGIRMSNHGIIRRSHLLDIQQFLKNFLRF